MGFTTFLMQCFEFLCLILFVLSSLRGLLLASRLEGKRVSCPRVEGYSSYKTVTSEFVQPKKSILWFRNNKFYFPCKKLTDSVVCCVLG